MIKLFVGGFPLDIEELQLAMMFGPHGDISTLKIVRDKKTRICKGYAFIEMTDRKGAENAVEALDGTMLNGKALTVNINEEETTVAQPSYTKTNYNQTTNPQRSGNAPVEPRQKRPRLIKR